MRRGKAEMAWTGQTPWHGLGQQLPAGADIDTWRTAAGMDWQIGEAPVFFHPDPETMRSFPDRKVLFRDDTNAGLGIVSDGYQVVQPKQVLEFFRDLTAENGFTLETAGTLHGGKRFWALARVTADAPILDAGDKVGGYLLLSTSADGSLSTEGRYTMVRVVCQNTLSLARRGAAGVRVTHRSLFDEQAAKDALGIKPGKARETIEETMEQFREMARTPLGRFDMVDLTLKLFGHDPAKLSAKELQDAASSRGVQQVGELAIAGNGLVGANLAGGDRTAWSWLNAVTQFVDHHARARTQSGRLDSAWFGRGDNMKSKALELAIAHSTGKQVLYADDPANDAGDGVLDRVLAATQAA
jgi:phage/plasmid-like protein (TIGR03299 family)